MDKRLEQALDFSNFRLILATQQNNLKTLMENNLILSYNKGLFKISKSLIVFIKNLIISGETEYIFIDNNDIPILIKNLKEFEEIVFKTYTESLKKYYISYQKLNEAREIRKVIDWNEEK